MSKFKDAQFLIRSNTDCKPLADTLISHGYRLNRQDFYTALATRIQFYVVLLEDSGNVFLKDTQDPDINLIGNEFCLGNWLYENIKTVQMTQAEYDALHQSRIEYVEYMRNVENGVRIEAEPDPTMYKRDGKVWVNKTPLEKQTDIVRDLKTYTDNMVYMLSMLQNTRDFLTPPLSTTAQTYDAPMKDANNKRYARFLLGEALEILKDD